MLLSSIKMINNVLKMKKKDRQYLKTRMKELQKEKHYTE